MKILTTVFWSFVIFLTIILCGGYLFVSSETLSKYVTNEWVRASFVSVSGGIVVVMGIIAVGYLLLLISAVKREFRLGFNKNDANSLADYWGGVLTFPCVVLPHVMLFLLPISVFFYNNFNDALPFILLGAVTFGIGVNLKPGNYLEKCVRDRCDWTVKSKLPLVFIEQTAWNKCLLFVQTFGVYFAMGMLATHTQQGWQLFGIAIGMEAFSFFIQRSFWENK